MGARGSHQNLSVLAVINIKHVIIQYTSLDDDDSPIAARYGNKSGVISYYEEV